MINIGTALRVRRVISANTTGLCPSTPGSSRNCSRARSSRSSVRLVAGGNCRARPGSLLVKNFRRLHDLPICGEHRSISQPSSTSCKLMSRLSTPPKAGPENLIHVDLKPARATIRH